MPEMTGIGNHGTGVVLLQEDRAIPTDRAKAPKVDIREVDKRKTGIRVEYFCPRYYNFSSTNHVPQFNPLKSDGAIPVFVLNNFVKCEGCSKPS
jgi:hypothetical protein